MQRSKSSSFSVESLISDSSDKMVDQSMTIPLSHVAGAHDTARSPYSENELDLSRKETTFHSGLAANDEELKGNNSEDSLSQQTGQYLLIIIFISVYLLVFTNFKYRYI